MGHSNLIFVVGIGLIIATLTFGAAYNMRRNAEGPEIASEYRMAREIAISGLHLAKARLADNYLRWYFGDSTSNPYQGGMYEAISTPVDTGWVEIRSTGKYGRGEYLVLGGFVWELGDYDWGKKEKLTICHLTGSCSNPDETISISWNAWDEAAKHATHELVCTDSTGTWTRRDHIGACGEEPFFNISGVTMLQYSEWRIMN